MGMGNNNRKVMTLGWRLETEQLGYCMETADFCTGSNHCWLETPNPCLWGFLPFFCMHRKAHETSSDSPYHPLAHYTRVNASRLVGREQAGRAETWRGRSVPALQLPSDTHRNQGWAQGQPRRHFGGDIHCLLFLMDWVGSFPRTPV